MSLDPPPTITPEPTPEEIAKMAAYRPEPFAPQDEPQMPAGYQLIKYFRSPQWSWINPDGTKHTGEYDTAEAAIAAANQAA